MSMTVKWLLCACHNVLPGKTELKIVSDLGKTLYTGLWNDGFLQDFGDMTVLDFEIDRIKYNGVAAALMAWVIPETKEPARAGNTDEPKE